MHFRALRRDDRSAIERILRATGRFTDVEVQVALELVDIYLNQPQQQDYLFHVAVDEDDRLLGYVCFGPTPMTDGTFDLYWIAVDPQLQRQGVGTQLLAFVESELRARNGRLLMIETSSQPKYEPTHRFYLRHAYREVARIRDFYSTGDDRVIYSKLLRER